MTKGLMSFFSTLQYSITPVPMPIGAKPLTFYPSKGSLRRLPMLETCRGRDEKNIVHH